VLASELHVVSWNLTQRCNLSCDHCYLDAYSG
jgi:MoaA/NifB/PqqE/SkfB family radical SAM enzyme